MTTTSERIASRTHIADRLTSRRGAWITLGISLVVFLAVFGLLSGASGADRGNAEPPDSESAQAAALLDHFPDADTQSVLIVASRSDASPLDDAQTAALSDLLPVINSQPGMDASQPRVSDDGQAAVIAASMTSPSGDTETDIDNLRSAIADQTAADSSLASMDVYVTGGPAFGADIASAFDGANFTLLAVTILIVALLLIITYRSPILWLLPLAVVAIADQMAGTVTAAVGGALDLHFDAGIISVLVFGAGTNYALLLISRYREELAVSVDHRAAMATAWRRTVPAILASNVTVVLSLLSLVLAVIPGTHGLGVASAIGLIIAVVGVLFTLPALLAVCGRKVFWPRVPRVGSTVKAGRVWSGIARGVVRRPWVGLTAGVVLLAVMATGLIGSSVGLTQVEKFRVQSDSATGLDVLSAHFPPGDAQPIWIVAHSGEADAVQAAAANVPGVVRANVVGQTTDGQWSKIMVTGDYAPGSDASRNQIVELRSAAHAVSGADAKVGGAEAVEVDAQAGNDRDLIVIAPIILIISFLILMLLLRSLVAPAVLLLVNLASATAAIGAGAWLSSIVLGQHALDQQVPLLAFLFLVALGIDYTIFLVHRAHAEAQQHGTKEGMIRAVAHTGGVITSAGVVLAGVFAALGVLPLVVLGQLGLIVSVGVLVDTLVVRTVIVPSLFSLIGDRIWWPSRLRDQSSKNAKYGCVLPPPSIGTVSASTLVNE